MCNLYKGPTCTIGNIMRIRPIIGNIMKIRSIKNIEHPEHVGAFEKMFYILKELIKYELGRSSYVFMFCGTWGIKKVGLMGS